MNTQRGPACRQAGFTVVLGLLIVIIVCGLLFAGYYLGRSSLSSENSNSQTPQEKTEETSLSQEPDKTPMPNALYLGKFKGEDSVFVTNSDLGKYHIDGVAKFSENIGSVTSIMGYGESPVDYKSLQNPQKILSLSFDVLQINNIKFTDNKKYIYLSIMLVTMPSKQYPDDVTNHIYRVDLNNFKSEELWSHDMSPDKYKNAGGATYIREVSSDNNFFASDIAQCFACDGGKAGMIVVNTQTKKEKYFEDIGNIKFDLDKKIFTYQKLAPFKEDCGPESGQGCDENNERTLLKPSGQTYSEALP